MWQQRLGSLELRVEHRRAAGTGGPTLRVLGGGAELLRFDCFEHKPHFHVAPEGRDEMASIPSRDPIEWTARLLAGDLPEQLRAAGYRGAADWSAEDQPHALAAAERAMRNPPARLDDLDVELLKSHLGEKWNVYDSEVLPAWVAQMDYPLAEPIRRVLDTAVKGSDLGYPISPRETPVLELFAERMQSRFAWSVDPRRAEIVSDVVQGIYLAMSLLRGERDGVIVQTPIYPPFLRGVRETGSRLVENRLVFSEGGWQVDLDGLHRAVDDGAGVLLLCNPHNPTGRVLTRDELEATARLAVDRDLLVVSDEIHSDLVYAGAEHIPIASLGPEIAARTLTLSSASKAFNIPGLRCAVAHFGSTEMQQRFNQAAPRRSRGGIGILGLSATEAAWRHSDPWLDEVRSYLEANRDFLGAEIARRFPGVRFHSPEASYLAWLDWSAFELEPTPARFFLEHGRVALSDGRLFGAGFESYARINFATSRTLLTQVLDRMQGALSSKGA